MPFKDSDTNPDLKNGWNGKRSMEFGASVLKVIKLSSDEGLF